jgi:phosphatidate cytidylyltransferase
MRRIATAALLVPLVLYVVFWAPLPVFQLAVAAMAWVCFHEFSWIAQSQKIPVPEALGHVLGLAFLFLPRMDYLVPVLLFMILSTWAMRARQLSDALAMASATLLGIIYIYGGWRCVLTLREVGPWWLMMAVSINWVGDTAAYYVGKNFGRRKLAPRVSPGKTWEGAVASAVLGTLYGMLLLLSFARIEIPMWHAVLLSLVAGVAGQVGDLVESAMKRGAGVKDSGHLLPGHGGWLDRLDSTMFSVPVVALYLRFVVQGN